MSSENYKAVKRTLWLIMAANIAVAAAKLALGCIAGSRSVFADGVHSLADSFSNILGLIGIRMSEKPGDRKHPYGHGKFEIIASMFIGIMLSGMALKIIAGAAAGLRNPQPLNFDMRKTAIMAATVLVNSFVAIFEYRCGKRLGSRILVTDSLHTRGDVMVSCAVLAGLAAIGAGAPHSVDSAVSLCVAVFVLFSGIKIIKDCTDVLADSAAVDSEWIAETVKSVDGVIDVHRIRSRGDSSKIFMDLHIIVSPDMRVVRAHELSHELEKILKTRFGEATEVAVHIEPDDGRHKSGGQQVG